MNEKVRGKREEVRGEGEGKKSKKLPIWKTAKHSSEIVSKITLPHVVDVFTAQHLLDDAMPSFVGIVALEVKYVIYPDYMAARKLADECWDEYMKSHGITKKGGDK